MKPKTIAKIIAVVGGEMIAVGTAINNGASWKVAVLVGLGTALTGVAALLITLPSKGQK